MKLGSGKPLHNHPPYGIEGDRYRFIVNIAKWDYYLYSDSRGYNIFRRSPENGNANSGKIFLLDGEHLYHEEPKDNIAEFLGGWAKANVNWDTLTLKQK